ncbi:hypothetical protein Q9L58_010714, partial [Maublancomyces gigas]
MPPIDLLLDKTTQRYGIRILLSPDDHPCKKLLLAFLRQSKPAIDGTGLRRVCDVMKRLIPSSPQIEDPTHHKLEWMAPPIIPPLYKTVEAANHMAWLSGLQVGTILAYSDGSKETGGPTASAWHISQTKAKGTIIITEGCCQIGNNCEIEDGEIHAIQEALHELVKRGGQNENIYLC